MKHAHFTTEDFVRSGIATGAGGLAYLHPGAPSTSRSVPYADARIEDEDDPVRKAFLQRRARELLAWLDRRSVRVIPASRKSDLRERGRPA
jgi:hypothetical protein